MIVMGKLSGKGVHISRAYTGKHQGYVHVSDGVYWEAMYLHSPEEQVIQDVVTDKSFVPTHNTALDKRWFKRVAACQSPKK